MKDCFPKNIIISAYFLFQNPQLVNSLESFLKEGTMRILEYYFLCSNNQGTEHFLGVNGLLGRV